MGIASDQPRAAATPRVVVVDDDPDLRSLIGGFLREHHFDVVTAADAGGLTARLGESPVDLILLDLMMPGEDGLSVLRRIDGPNRPGIIVLSAMGDEHDRIEGLELGADDYLAKPCNPRELLARIRAVLRRRDEVRLAVGNRDFRFGGWRLDVIARRLSHATAPSTQLTDAEFRVLKVLLETPQTVLSRDQLLDAAHGASADIFDRAIDVTISRLRRKLDPENLIRTVRNEGYMLAVTPEAA
ncbi:response regulator [Polymorphobacter fuscus]|uniref:Response regulator n=1 Tax=Sandarakinorhabdus fusca TaxID=1439888 RepID=A0A7C9KWW9_9SPHN|nr:response regulator transcription factor [Polymorphobacter fuscus]KAB7646163.1 response regulator transcription factor [Polymorphobacter fuscus]MQT17365.1 response regulator [Polymorphobacter fuscus]NJC10101.1 two-component system OmpR family response regulator [Polymorphobacter fuscus]